MKRLLQIGIIAALALTTPAMAGKKASPTKNEWRGWWFIYYRKPDGALGLDKFIKVMVIDDKMNPRSGRVTGQWIGCVWLQPNGVRYENGNPSLTFLSGEDSYTFSMTRTGPDDAEGIYLDEPTIKYVVKRKHDHASECPGIASDKKR